MSDTVRNNGALVTAETVRALARVADLPLAEDRVEAIATQLDGLLVEANRVNRFMESRRSVQPATPYHHPEIEEQVP